MKAKAERNYMKRAPRLGVLAVWLAMTLLACSPWKAEAQSCQTVNDLDEATKSAITTAAQRYFTMAAGGDAESLKQNAIASLASNFTDVEGSVKLRQERLAGTPATVKSAFLLEEQGAAPDPHAEFFCGVFGKNGPTATAAKFDLMNLPPGKYAIVLMEATSTKGRTYFSPVLQVEGTDWKLAGLYIKPAQIAGHDGDWFVNQARQFKAKGQMHNAALFYQEARNLSAPLSFMGTLATDKLYDEAQTAQPPDFPAEGKTTELIANGATYRLTGIYPALEGNDLDVVVKYQVPDARNANQCFQSNMAVMKALLVKYPELRDAFPGMNSRAVDTNGRDYSTLLPMKDIK